MERVHAANPAVPIGLADTLSTFWAEMVSHMRKEEEVLFPRILQGMTGPMVAMPIQVLESEHDEHAVHFARIRELTGELETPAHACATWSALYEGLRTLEAVFARARGSDR